MEYTARVKQIAGADLLLEVGSPAVRLLVEQCQKHVRVIVDDGRTISTEQRMAIYATMRDISEHTGFLTDEVKDVMKWRFLAKTGCEPFSLSDVDKTTAHEFLQFLIEFCVEWGVPVHESLLKRAPDIERYVYCCLRHKKCCICGRKADLHHVDAVGMGRDRREIIHEGMMVLPLAREYHQEFHRMGRDSFLKKYHLAPVRMTHELCEVWGLKGRTG